MLDNSYLYTKKNFQLAEFLFKPSRFIYLILYILFITNNKNQECYE